MIQSIADTAIDADVKIGSLLATARIKVNN
jgi:hypothetical protein